MNQIKNTDSDYYDKLKEYTESQNKFRHSNDMLFIKKAELYTIEFDIKNNFFPLDSLKEKIEERRKLQEQISELEKEKNQHNLLMKLSEKEILKIVSKIKSNILTKSEKIELGINDDKKPKNFLNKLVYDAFDKALKEDSEFKKLEKDWMNKNVVGKDTKEKQSPKKMRMILKEKYLKNKKIEDSTLDRYIQTKLRERKSVYKNQRKKEKSKK